MATNANFNMKFTGGGVLTVPSTVVLPTSTLSIISGSSISGTLQSFDVNWGNGSGTSQIDNWYYVENTLAATTAANVDMKTAVNELGATLSFTLLKAIILRILSPDGTLAIQVGPAAGGGGALTNAWVGTLFNANTDFLTIKHQLMWFNQFGETVDSTHKVMGIYNPGANPVTYDLWLLAV